MVLYKIRVSTGVKMWNVVFWIVILSHSTLNMRQYVPLNCWYPPTGKHSVTIQKTTIHNCMASFRSFSVRFGFKFNINYLGIDLIPLSSFKWHTLN
jgi:hypothetical protein